MELNEFITEAITQITRGISEAQSTLADEWVRVNPKPVSGTEAVAPMLYTAENGAGVFPLAFDVAVSAEGKSGGREAGIQVLGVGINLKEGSAASRSTVSRVSFTVPIAYPLKRLNNRDEEP
jgi:hypothetical protein